MRIICKWADVYDLQNSMFDKDKVWERKSEDLLVKVTDVAEKNILQQRQVSGGFNDAYYKIQPLFLAGEIYWLHTFEERLRYTESTRFCTFNIDTMFKYFEDNDLNIRSYFDDKSKDIKATLNDWMIEATPKAQKILEELRVPIAFVEGIQKAEKDESRLFKIKTNIRFHQSGIPWQEIESNLYRFHQHLTQYIWGVLGSGEPDMITVSDKDRLLAHGFDAKTSFRKTK